MRRDPVPAHRLVRILHDDVAVVIGLGGRVGQVLDVDFLLVGLVEEGGLAGSRDGGEDRCGADGGVDDVGALGLNLSAPDRYGAVVSGPLLAGDEEVQVAVADGDERGVEDVVVGRGGVGVLVVDGVGTCDETCGKCGQ